MPNNLDSIHRRNFLKSLLSSAVILSARPVLANVVNQFITNKIPVSGERIPAIGMGTWKTFDISSENEVQLNIRRKILEIFFQRGGTMIDSSPMYGNAEEVIGECLGLLDRKYPTFSTTKVWTHGQWMGKQQMKRSLYLWGAKQFDLMQIHNLLDWQSHMPTLREWKQQGKIRYIGVTTSHGRRHEELESLMKQEQLDFVQLTYNINNRQAEKRLLPLAAERGIAVIINRPFQHGYLFDEIKNKKLPSWAREFDCDNWAQFFLKFVISHPAVTCAIPATSQVIHMQENMGACYGRLPDKSLRIKMIQYFNS